MKKIEKVRTDISEIEHRRKLKKKNPGSLKRIHKPLAKMRKEKRDIITKPISGMKKNYHYRPQRYYKSNKGLLQTTLYT